jgi:protein-tyrosine phosphatase
MDRVLFLCSANYYRSRFAEYFFNHLAEANALRCRADSCGLMVGFWGNIGPISHCAVDGLKARGVPIDGVCREPRQVTEADFAAADLVVAVKEDEHRPMMRRLFPQWADAIEYWHIDDLDCAQPEEALPLLEDKVRALVARFGMPQSYAGEKDEHGN